MSSWKITRDQGKSRTMHGQDGDSTSRSRAVSLTPSHRAFSVLPITKAALWWRKHTRTAQYSTSSGMLTLQNGTWLATCNVPRSKRASALRSSRHRPSSASGASGSRGYPQISAVRPPASSRIGSCQLLRLSTSQLLRSRVGGIAKSEQNNVDELYVIANTQVSLPGSRRYREKVVGAASHRARWKAIRLVNILCDGGLCVLLRLPDFAAAPAPCRFQGHRCCCHRRPALQLQLIPLERLAHESTAR